jgi:hypothetical protein
VNPLQSSTLVSTLRRHTARAKALIPFIQSLLVFASIYAALKLTTSSLNEVSLCLYLCGSMLANPIAAVSAECHYRQRTMAGTTDYSRLLLVALGTLPVYALEAVHALHPTWKLLAVSANVPATGFQAGVLVIGGWLLAMGCAFIWMEVFDRNQPVTA